MTIAVDLGRKATKQQQQQQQFSKYSFRNNIRVPKPGLTFCFKQFAKVISRRVKKRDYVIPPQSNSLARLYMHTFLLYDIVTEFFTNSSKSICHPLHTALVFDTIDPRGMGRSRGGGGVTINVGVLVGEEVFGCQLNYRSFGINFYLSFYGV